MEKDSKTTVAVERTTFAKLDLLILDFPFKGVYNPPFRIVLFS